jgi:spore coat polysaccharide biosynthesis protein SpsF (cytidylyltransferase family)
LLGFQLNRLKNAFPDSPLVIATSISAADDAIEEIATRLGVTCYRGDEQDVLGRFVNCCNNYHFTDYIIRICGDNPFLQPEFLRELMEGSVEKEVDYISHAVNQIPAIRTHFGFFAEMVRVSALERANAVVDMGDREHVTSYIYGVGGEEFRVRWLAADGLAPYINSVRLTVDTREDLENTLTVYRGLRSEGAGDGEGVRSEGAGDGEEVRDGEDNWRTIIRFIDGHPATKANMERQIRLFQK